VQSEVLLLLLLLLLLGISCSTFAFAQRLLPCTVDEILMRMTRRQKPVNTALKGQNKCMHESSFCKGRREP
jgi:hypothetical protein